MSLTSSSWRRVASTHSLSDLLLDGDTGDTGDTGAHEDANTPTHGVGAHGKPADGRRQPRSLRSLCTRLLGIACILIGAFGLLASLFVATSCFPWPTNGKHVNERIQCSARLLSIWHRTYIELGLHGVIVPALSAVGRLLEVFTTAPKGPDGASSSELHPLSLSALLVDRAIALLEVAYPADEVAFWEAVDARGGRASEVALYGLAVPVLCGPVTFAMVAVNWFSLKLVKHN